MKLPELFLESMQQLLGADYEAWLDSCMQPGYQGLRINTWKLDRETWEQQMNPFALERIPWTGNGYFYERTDQPAKHAFYYAGLYYLQEPSAMAPAQLLPVEPGDKILDICAAPGGKSTELGARLGGRGLLVANDISNSRAKALLKNLELFGIENICVTSEAPAKLAAAFDGFFDKILVDAPCSGEGMFRKDAALIRSWQERGPEAYAPLQHEILTAAVAMLKPGGYLLYSTCTFSPLEDEAMVQRILKEQPAMMLMPLTAFDGAAPGIGGEPVIRLFPHKIRGEGHFIALFRKSDKDSEAADGKAIAKPQIEVRKDWQRLEKETDFFAFMADVGRDFERNRLMVRQEQVYYLPEVFSGQWKLRYLRTGLLLGELKKGRFSPSQALAMALRAGQFARTISFAVSDDRVARYLKGETIALLPAEQDVKGWCLVCVAGYPLGWAKGSGRALKNKYYPGWRLQGELTTLTPSTERGSFC